MSNSAWTQLNSDRTVLKIQTLCGREGCKCQKQITFTRRQIQLEGIGFKHTVKRIFKKSQTAWSKFIKPGLQTAPPVFSGAVAAKTKNTQVSQTASFIMTSIGGGKTLSLTDMHGNGLRLRVL